MTTRIATAVWKMRLVLRGRLRRMDFPEGFAVGTMLSEAASGLRYVPRHASHGVCSAGEAEEEHGLEHGHHDVAYLVAEQRIHDDAGQQDRDEERACQRDPSGGDHDGVVTAVVGSGVIELELLLDGAVVIGSVAFEASTTLEARG
jgi:hypothetical protein